MRWPRFSSGVWVVMVALVACAGNATAPPTSTQRSAPSMSQTEAAPSPMPTTQRVHFAGLPPAGAPVSEPAVDELLFSISPTLRSSWNVYVDGWMIWQEFDRSGDPIVVPPGARRVDTGFVEQRLTPRGIQLLRSKILSTGLFDHSRWLDSGRHHPRFMAGMREGDRWVSIETVPFTDPSWDVHFTDETPAQARALAQLKAMIGDLTDRLPATAWAGRRIRSFVPSRYFVVFERGTLDRSELRSPAREQLLQLNELFLNACQVVTTGRARTLLQALVEAGYQPSDNHAFGIGFDLPGGSFPKYLHFQVALPEETKCP